MILKRLKSSFNAINSTSLQTGAKGFERFKIILDIIYCRKFLHCTYKEYLQYKFFNYKNRYRKQFMLEYHQRKCLHYINTKNFTRSKFNFYLRIPECYEREIIFAPSCGAEKFLAFVKKHKKIVTKPDCGSYGRDILILEYTNDADILAHFESITQNTICEEFVVQHDVMNQLNPASVNTIRIVSLRKDDAVEITSASLRTAKQTGSFVDNMRSGGIGAQVDLQTGIVTTFGYDYEGNKYITHPSTNCTFMGLKLPNWDTAIDLVKRAHGRLPECALLGWDIALTKTGADIIEANNAPGPLLTQFTDLIPKGKDVITQIKISKKSGANPNK